MPGYELVAAGIADLRAGRETVAAMLLKSAETRLVGLGIVLPGPPVDDASLRMYRLVEVQVGDALAHSQYNALRRRLASFLRAAQLA